MSLELKEHFCIFCGKYPQSKTKEHVLPLWLIELTGDPKRQLVVGPFLSKEFEEWYRAQSFDSFHFPACEVCNNKFGELEARASGIVLKLLGDQPLTATDFHVLFDWLDKIRIGLWLGFHQYLDGNIYGIKPRFYIDQRMGLLDRMVLIATADDRPTGLHLFGFQTPAFANMPSCFAIFINGYALLNVSENLLLGEGLGLPRLKETILIEGPQVGYVAEPGSGTVSVPVLQSSPHIQGTGLFQANYPRRLMPGPVPAMFNTEHVRDMFDSVETGVGKILIESNNSVLPYPEIGATDWIPKHKYTLQQLLELLPEWVLRMQIKLIDRGIEKSAFGDEGQGVLDRLKFCKEFNETILANFTEL